MNKRRVAEIVSRLAKLSFRQKMILGSIAAFFIPLFIAGLFTYVNITTALERLSEEKVLQIARDISALIDVTLKQETKIASMLSRDPAIIKAVAGKEYERANRLLNEIYTRTNTTDYETFFILDRNGILSAEAKGRKGLSRVSGADRFYFREAKAGRIGIEGPITSRYSGTQMLMISSPLYRGDEFVGAAVAGLKIGFMVDKIASIRLGKTGYAFITDRDSLIIFHPLKEYELKDRLAETQGADELGRLIMGTQPGIAHYTVARGSLENTRKLAGVAPVELTDWKVVFTQNLDEIMAPARAILYSLMASAVVFVFIVVVTLIYLSGQISNPVEKIMDILKQLMLHSNEAIVMIGRDRKITLANHTYEKITGRTVDELLGTGPVLSNRNGISEETIWRTLESGQSWTGNILLERTELEQATLSVMILPLMEKSSIHGYLEIGRDISKELVVETRLRQSQKMESMGVMAGGIAHDFNNILAGIFGYAELMLVMPSTTDFPVIVKSYTREILNAAERARELVRQILTFSRRTEIELHPVIPKYIIKEALKLIHASTPASIEFRVALNSDSMVMAEPTQIHQVIINLCNNAVYAMQDRNGILEISLEDIDVDEEFMRQHPGMSQGRHMRFSVSDTGTGMESAMLERIFEPFFTTKPQGEGTGLGLAVVHGIVKNMHGIIVVYSEAGKGTTFHVLLPVTGAGEIVAAKQEDKIIGGSERVMLVDDEEPIRKVISQILTNFGYRVSAFAEGQEALAAMRKDPTAYDVIITDYSMPHMTGLELAQEIKTIRLDIPIILSSGFLSETKKELTFQAGISEVLRKPVISHELARAIRKVLDEQRNDTVSMEKTGPEVA
jgi:PAS domain S-box-containing protein